MRCFSRRRLIVNLALYLPHALSGRVLRKILDKREAVLMAGSALLSIEADLQLRASSTLHKTHHGLSLAGKIRTWERTLFERSFGSFCLLLQSQFRRLVSRVEWRISLGSLFNEEQSFLGWEERAHACTRRGVWIELHDKYYLYYYLLGVGLNLSSQWKHPQECWDVIYATVMCRK